MPRAKKNGHFLSCYIKTALWDTLSRYSRETLIPKTSVLEQALEEYFVSRGKTVETDKKSELDNI